ncbi:hypothetical protein C8E03_101406 [Lachnotalea glycerini]|uniref:Uncharacterized protein n=1 Tax=Lachnotalea glycerini TaxID=1763509 RepID=A0A318EXH2_9FIRM|nr:hypothetical protein [Lachnotalea glycerini]PXV95776.1 hypothetical protein C8E03_101406 [Lachnotalea glycerini]
MINKNKAIRTAKTFKKLIRLIFCCILLSCIGTHPVKAAASNELSAEISYGYNLITKTDTNSPLTISVTNQGSEFNGTVQVILSAVTTTNSATQAIMLNGYKEKNYMYEKTAHIAADATTDVSLIIPLKYRSNQLRIMIYDEYGNELFNGIKVIESEDYSYYVYAAVFTDSPSVLNYFENTAIYQYNDYTFKSIIISQEDIPQENYALDLFDIIIANQNQLDSLTKEQSKVIDNWVKNGGFLVLVNDANESISWETVIPDEEIRKLNYSYRSYTDWAITYALSSVFMNNLPDFTIFIIALIIYSIIMGPLLYLLLKKLNKRKFFWLCEITASVLFTFLIIILGNSTRLKAPFLNYFKIVTYNEKTIDDSVYFNIRAPFNNEYKLYVDKEYSFKPIFDTVYYDDRNKKFNLNDYNVGISYGEQENTITIKNDVAFTKENFIAEKSEEANSSDYISVNMNLFGDKVSGFVTNYMDYSIENAAILVYNKVIFLDTIPAGSTINLDDMKIYTYNPKFKYGLTNAIANLKTTEKGLIQDGYMLQNQKKSILDFYLEKKFGYYTDKAYLIGFAKDMNQLDLQLDSAYDAYGMTLIEVPVDVDYTCDNLEYTTYVPIKNEEYSSSGDVMYTDEMILTYNLGQNLKDINLYFNDLSYFDDKYYKTFSGHIYFYNRVTTLYDPIDLSQKNIFSHELKPYLNDQNEIVVKYVEHFDEEEKQALLPSLSTIGRVNDVEN